MTEWDFEPAQKLGGVVSNITGGFDVQIRGAVSGKGKVSVAWQPSKGVDLLRWPLLPSFGGCLPCEPAN